MRVLRIPRTSARYSISALLARPSTGGAVIRMRRVPSSRIPATSVRRALGVTRTVRAAPRSPLCSLNFRISNPSACPEYLNENGLENLDQDEQDDRAEVEHADRWKDAANGCEHRIDDGIQRSAQGVVRRQEVAEEDVGQDDQSQRQGYDLDDADQVHSSSCPRWALPKDSTTHPKQGGPFLDGDLKVVAHPHRQL